MPGVWNGDMKGRPRRLQRWAKWVGLTACVISFLALLSSFIFTVTMYRSGWSAVLGFGDVIVQSTNAQYGNPQQGWAFKKRLASEPIVFQWWVRLRNPVESVWQVIVPTWIPLVALTMPTAFLWYRDRRTPPGHCQSCGYNLTGNTSGVCPECGTEVGGATDG